MARVRRLRMLPACLALSILAAACSRTVDATMPRNQVDAPTAVERLLREIGEAGLDDEALLRRLYSGALQEDPIVQYVTNGNPRPEVWIPAFEAAFPGVRLDMLQLSAPDTNDRVLAEAALGRSRADVITTTLPGIALLADADILAGSIEALVPPAMDGRYVGASHVIVASNPYAIAWNTDLWAGEQARDWDDAVTAEWPGCVVSDTSLSWFAGMIGGSGEEGLRSWVSRAEQNGGGIRFGRSNSSLATSLAAGEERCMVGTSASVRRVARDGAPLAYSSPPLSPAAHQAFSIRRDTRSPHGAALLVAWGLRAEAAALYVGIEVYPTNGATADVRPPADEFVPSLEDVLDQERRAAQLLAELSSELSG